MKPAEPLYQYASKPGATLYSLLIGIQAVFLIIGVLLFGLSKQWLVYSVLQLVTLLLAGYWFYQKQLVFPNLVYCDGTWGIQDEPRSAISFIKPLEQSSIFPACLLLLFRDEDNKKRWLILWADVLGQAQFRQLCRQLNQYFFLVRKSQNSVQ